MRRLLLLVLLLPILANAQSVKLTFANEASRKVWVAASVHDAPPPVVGSSSKEHTIANASGILCVLDEASGNLATKPAKGLSVWAVKDSDFSLIGQIEAGAEPALATASYTCQGQSFLVTPEGAQKATFYGLKPGSIEVAVTMAQKGENVTKRQTFDVPLKRVEAVPRLLIGLETEATPPLPTSKNTPAPATRSGNLVGTLVSIVLVAALAVTLLVLGLRWIYSNQDKAQSALGKLGVQIPDPLSPDPPPATSAPPVNPISDPAPMSPIVLPGAVASVAAVGGIPRLVGPAGTFELSEGVHVLGREAGLTISLTGESTLSRRHAEMVVSGTQITLRDLGSTNGTFLNGQPVTSDASLRVGDSVRFGAVQFKVEG